MKTVFFGTPEIAAIILKDLLESDIEVSAVVTQPDKPKGRGGNMEFPEVKKLALEHGLDVMQPLKMKDEAFLTWLRGYEPDVIVVAAYGRLIPEEILNMPKYGCINVHTSLLPKYRGSSPIQAAVLNGDRESGVTIMHMDKTLDTGDIILQEKTELIDGETAGTLYDRLANMSGEVLIKALHMLEDGTATRTKQGDDATYVGMISKEMGHIDFKKPAVQIERLIRGMNPWPSAYTYYDGKLLKIWKAQVISAADAASFEKHFRAGQIVSVDKNDFVILTGEGALRVLEVQLEGKKRMNCGDFLRGTKVETGYYFAD